MTQRSVSLPSGVRTSVIDAGRGPAVLLLHGNPDNADEWQGVIEALAAEHRCVAPDLPGYGARDRICALPGSFDYSVGAQVRFVDELLAALELDAVTLVVHDIGGIMGVPWAAANLGRLRGVVYTNTVAFPDFPWFRLARQWGSARPLDRLRSRLMMAAVGLGGGAAFRRAFGRQNPQLSPAALARFARDFAVNRVAKATTLRQFRVITQPRFFAGYDEMLRAIAAATPTCAVWGEGDPYVPDARAVELLAATTVRLPGVGHWVPLLAADAVAAQVRLVSASARPQPRA
ncbi:MAG: alpha/beta fold hydrolase [Myxococcales bacterium]|nr:alpha/beta fold hydrolase [Myxococcales bacterium]